MKKLVIMVVIALSACGKAKDEPDAQPATTDVADEFHHYQDRLVGMLDNGWVVSRDDAGGVRNEGDALIWLGTALGALDCAAGDALEQAAIAMLQETGGKLYRHPSMKDDVSLDGAIGLYFGIARRIERCDGAYVRWASAIPAGFWSDPLNETDGLKLAPEWTYVREMLQSMLADGARPDPARRAKLESEVAAWALGVNATHAACFRVNLGWLTLKTLDSLGDGPSQHGRDEFCTATRGMDIPLTRAYCGDDAALPDYVASFQENEWEFRHQRCGGWEQPDGNGLQTPALDFLMAVREGFQI